MRRAILTEIDLPDFGISLEQPEIEPRLYRERFASFMDRVRGEGLDGAVIYADREHGANMAWISGFEPRFEEAVLVVMQGRDPVLITGPENQGPARLSPIDTRVILYPPFGLMGQDRDATPSLRGVLADAGIGPGAGLGLLGWKYYGEAEFDRPELRSELPSFLVDLIRELTGDRGSVVNANAVMMHPETGLRATVEIDELARFEFAACHTSEAVKRVVMGTRPGMSEFDCARLLEPIGLPLSCHTMFSSGSRAWHGLLSPTSRKVDRGEAVTTAYGVQGALNCRAGWLAADESDLSDTIRDYVPKLVAPYFEAVVDWLENISVGAAGGELYARVMKRLGDEFYGVKLNPGHLIHLDEWMHSPVSRNSTSRFRSGMALQVDIIPATGGPYFTTNIEDGIALLDEAGRARMAGKYPDAFERIRLRREFMIDVLGIRLPPEVMPFSNLASFLPPFWLSPGRAMAMR